MGKQHTEKPDVVGVLEASPHSSVEEVAEALGVARSTAHKRLAAAIAEGKAQRHAGGREGRRRLPDRYTAIEGPQAGEDGAGDAKGGSERRSEERPTRLRPGELDGLVLSYIADHRDEAPFGPTAVARALRRSSGAVGNCLERLSGHGEVSRVGEKPRRYGPKAG